MGAASFLSLLLTGAFMVQGALTFTSRSLRGNFEAAINVSHKYSQFGQDRWLSNLFGSDFKGFYLDIGAHDGVILSNTQALDERGWQGICVEPLPTGFQHRTCRLYERVLSDVSGQQVTFQDCTITGTDGGDGGLSGLKGVGNHSGTGARRLCNPVKFTTTSTVDFMNSVGNVPRIIDYVSMDVEGSEDQIFATFPWDKHCVKAFTIERPSSAVQQLMLDHGCAFSAILGEDHAYTCTCP